MLRPRKVHRATRARILEVFDPRRHWGTLVNHMDDRTGKSSRGSDERRSSSMTLLEPAQAGDQAAP